MTAYSVDRADLASLFPRGRFTKDEEGHCVLTARLARRASDFLYVQSPGRKLGIFYSGRGQAYRNALRDLIIDEIEADGEGILHVRWVPEVAERLPWFSRKRWNGAGVLAFEKRPKEKAGPGLSDGVPLSSTQGVGVSARQRPEKPEVTP